MKVKKAVSGGGPGMPAKVREEVREPSRAERKLGAQTRDVGRAASTAVMRGTGGVAHGGACGSVPVCSPCALPFPANNFSI